MPPPQSSTINGTAPNIDDVWGKKDIRLAAIKQLYPDIHTDKTDILFYFIAKAITLCKGEVGFIVSRAFLEAYKAKKLRGFILENAALDSIIDFQNYRVFPGVGITTCIINLKKDGKPGTFTVFKLTADKTYEPGILAEQLEDKELFLKIKSQQKSLTDDTWNFVSGSSAAINQKIDAAGSHLGDIFIVGQGMQTGLNDVFGGRTAEKLRAWKVPGTMLRKRASNTDIQRYFIRDREEYLLYPEPAKTFSELPKGVQSHLEKNGKELKARAAYKRENCEWWKFTWPLNKEYYGRKRILCPYLAKFNRFAIDLNDEFLGLTDTTVIFDNGQPESLLYILGLLNSKLLTFRFKAIGKLKSGGIYEYFWNSISKIPIRRIDFSDATDRARHDRMVAHVKEMHVLNAELQKSKSAQQSEAASRQTAAIDEQIDQLTYSLYGLTEEEIRAIESSAN